MKRDSLSGTVRTVKTRAGVVIGYRALLPREMSVPPQGCRNPDRYQQPIGEMFATADEARTLLDAAIEERIRSKGEIKALTFGWYVQREIQARFQAARRAYETDARANRAVSTWRSIDRIWLSNLEWRDVKPERVTPEDVQRFVNHLTDEAEGPRGDPLSGDFIRNVVRLVRATFERALVRPNPAGDLTLPPKGKPRVRYIDLPAQRKLFGSSEIPLADRTMAGCAMGAGLRVGELLAMEARGVRLDDQDPHLWVEFGGADRSPTKSRSARRVELFEPGLGFWRLWMETHYRGGTLVFAGPSGGYQKHWPELFPEWAQHAGVERLSSHGMRHSYAVAMLSGSWGYEPKTLEFVSQQLGHAEITTTQRYYGAFERGTWQREVRRMTGRSVPARVGDAITAEQLLCLAHQARDASAVWPSSNVASGGSSGHVPRHSPHSLKTSRNSARSDAFAHQTSAALARLVQELTSRGDAAAALEVATALADRELARPKARLAALVKAGGQHVFTHAVELASLILQDAQPESDEASDVG